MVWRTDTSMCLDSRILVVDPGPAGSGCTSSTHIHRSRCSRSMHFLLPLDVSHVSSIADVCQHLVLNLYIAPTRCADQPRQHVTMPGWTYAILRFVYKRPFSRNESPMQCPHLPIRHLPLSVNQLWATRVWDCHKHRCVPCFHSVFKHEDMQNTNPCQNPASSLGTMGDC